MNELSHEGRYRGPVRWPKHVSVKIEIPRWSFVKYADRPEGTRIEFISPLPAPFNYGYCTEFLGGDGLPLDVIALGPRLARGELRTLEVYGVAKFVDRGVVDDKLICGTSPPSPWQLRVVGLGLTAYAYLRRLVNRWRKEAGRTAFLGITRYCNVP